MTIEEIVSAVYPDVHESFDGTTYWIWGTTTMPKLCLAAAGSSDSAWENAYSKLTQPKDTQNEAKQRVLAVYRDAYYAVAVGTEIPYFITTKLGTLGIGGRLSDYCESVELAWISAASKLTPTAIGPECIKNCALPEGHTGKCDTRRCQHGVWLATHCRKCAALLEGIKGISEPTAIPAPTCIHGMCPDQHCRICQGLSFGDSAIPAQEAKSGWIDVRDALPDENQDVLCFYGSIGLVTYRPDSHNYRWDCDTWGLEPDDVTHWQPLPAPPEVKK